MVEMPLSLQITTNVNFHSANAFIIDVKILESPCKANVTHHTSTKALIFYFKWRRNIGEDEIRILSS